MYIGHLASQDGRVFQPFFPLGEELHDLDLRKMLCRVVKESRGGLVFKAHRLFYHSTLGSNVMKKKRRVTSRGGMVGSASHSFRL